MKKILFIALFCITLFLGGCVSVVEPLEDLQKETEYMQTKIGETFSGIISGVTENGIYVELDNTIEGFIPVETLKGTFEHIPERFILKGTKESYSIGEELRVKVIGVDFDRRRTIFELIAKINKEKRK